VARLVHTLGMIVMGGIPNKEDVITLAQLVGHTEVPITMWLIVEQIATMAQ